MHMTLDADPTASLHCAALASAVRGLLLMTRTSAYARDCKYDIHLRLSNSEDYGHQRLTIAQQAAMRAPIGATRNDTGVVRSGEHGNNVGRRPNMIAER